MYHDQLFCILAPAAEQPLACIESTIARVGPQLSNALSDVGQVHYASLFVLPPRPVCEGSSREVIVGLELAVDRMKTRRDRDDLLRRLVAAGLDPLWPLFARHSALQDDAPASDRSVWLTDFFVRHIRAADGGFVGSRDITVDEVDDEAALYGALRAEAGVLAPLGLDRDVLAMRLCATPSVAAAAPVSATAQAAAMSQQDAMAAQRNADFPWAAHKADHQKPWCAPHLNPICRAGLIASRTLWGSWLLVATVIIGSLFAMIGSFVAVAALLILDQKPVWESLTLLGSPPEGVSLALAVLWFGGAFATWIGVYLWLKGVPTNVVVAFVIPGLLLFVAITFGVVGQLIGAVVARCVWGSGVSLLGGVLGGMLSVTILLSGWGLSWVAGATLLGIMIAVALIGALVLVSPDRGSRVVAWTAVAFFALLFALGHASLYFAVVAQPDAGWISKPLKFLNIDQGLLEDRAGEWRWINQHLLAIFRLDAMFLLALLMGLVAVTIAYVALRLAMRLNRSRSERITDDRQAIVVPRAHQVHESIVASEASLSNRCNHMISLTELRPWKPWRRFTILLALSTIGRLADTWFVSGMLGYASGIHFAHWYLVDGGRRLLFLSNYDGDFSGYLDEFIRGASEGVNLIWQGSHLLPRHAAGPGHPAVRHPRAFPTVRRFVLHGCDHEQWFKAYVRDSMLPHVFRFEAYDHSLQNILTARRLRNARVGKRTAIKDDMILRSLDR